MTLLNSDTPRPIITAIVALIVLTLVMGVSFLYEHRQLKQARQDITLITRERDEAQTETVTAMKAITLNNDVSQATHDHKQTVSQNSQSVSAYIRGKLSADTCANTTIDSGSVERLRGFAHGLH